jgi:hypothetical protein
MLEMSKMLDIPDAEFRFQNNTSTLSGHYMVRTLLL